jgi:serine/threonine protein kinase
MSRIDTWDKRAEFDAIRQVAADSGLAYAASLIQADTNVYGEQPLRKIGPYELLRFINGGGGGDVYEARHVHFNRRAAVKLLTTRNSGDKNARQRFLREMESIGKLDHPHIVRAFDADEVDGTPYLGMEFVDGENVESLASHVKQMPVADACEIVRQAALGLQHVHEAGLVHRDLKPSNLLVSKAGIVKVADLGLALLCRTESRDERLTSEKTVLGTVDYMAPEQADGSHDVDIRADIYGLGCTLFRLLVGRAPFAVPSNNSPVRKMWAQMSEPVPDVLQFRSDVPPQLIGILNKMMAKKRGERFAEPKQLAEALAPFCHKLDCALLFGIAGNTTSPERGPAELDDTRPDDSENSLVAKPTEVLPPTAANSSIIRRPFPRLVLAGAAIACLMVVVGWWSSVKATWPGSANGTTDTGKQLVVPDSGERVPPPNVPDERPLPPIQQQVALHWEKTFGAMPTELRWPGQSGIGSMQFDDGLKSLVVHSPDSVRLIKLGDYQGDGDITISVDFQSMARSGCCGFFFGYQSDDAAAPLWSAFHSIQIRFEPVTDHLPKVTVCRVHGVLDGRAKLITPLIRHEIDIVRADIRNECSLDVQMTRGGISAVSLNGQMCDSLVSDEENLRFAGQPYRGPFGLIVIRGTASFDNPSFSWRQQ